MTTRNENRAPRKPSKMKLISPHAFRQAPWRVQLQYIGLFLLALVSILVVAGIYLSISGQAAAAGLASYDNDQKRQDLERQIADRKARLALMTSASVMEARAKELGFERIDPSQAVYMEMPGYTGKSPVVLAPPPGIATTVEPVIKSTYRQSLWDWLFRGINQLSASVGGSNP
ncbi:MAG TPA: hypothetical protein DDW19_06275 [Anaerolineaceae bacterium]|jgi:hypothetical protein|nr:hypothetical protein [Anaerolineaceae bacterium]